MTDAVAQMLHGVEGFRVGHLGLRPTLTLTHSHSRLMMGAFPPRQHPPSMAKWANNNNTGGKRVFVCDKAEGKYFYWQHYYYVIIGICCLGYHHCGAGMVRDLFLSSFLIPVPRAHGDTRSLENGGVGALK